MCCFSFPALLIPQEHPDLGRAHLPGLPEEVRHISAVDDAVHSHRFTHNAQIELFDLSDHSDGG